MRFYRGLINGLIISSILWCGLAFAWDFTITIPNEQVEDFRAKFLAIHPNTETECGPEWEAGEGEVAADCPQVNKYTDAEWLKVKVIRWLKTQAGRGERVLYRDNFNGTTYEVE